jgi:dipeptidyl aminopeptidase/acylaminoacyl peptidase
MPLAARSFAAALLPFVLLAAGCGRRDAERAAPSTAAPSREVPGPRRMFALADDSTHGFSAGTVSPDGRRFAYALTEGSAENIWIVDVATGRSTKATDHRDAVRIWPEWSHDSRLLTYLVHYDSGRNQVAVLDVATGREQIVWTADRSHWPDTPLFWPDERVVFMRRGWPSAPHAGDTPPPQVWQVRPGAAAQPLEEVGAADFPAPTTPVASPDGRYAAWVGPVFREGSENGVWIVELETARQRCLAFVDRAAQPYWAAGGRELYLMGVTGRNQHWSALAVPVSSGRLYRLSDLARDVSAVSADSAGNVFEVRPGGPGRPSEVWMFPHAYAAARMRDTASAETPSCEPSPGTPQP